MHIFKRNNNLAYTINIWVRSRKLPNHIPLCAQPQTKLATADGPLIYLGSMCFLPLLLPNCSLTSACLNHDYSLKPSSNTTTHYIIYIPPASNNQFFQLPLEFSVCSDIINQSYFHYNYLNSQILIFTRKPDTRIY